MAAHLAADFYAVTVRQCEIQNDELGSILFDPIQGRFTRVMNRDLVAFTGQQNFEDAGNLPRILHH